MMYATLENLCFDLLFIQLGNVTFVRCFVSSVFSADCRFIHVKKDLIRIIKEKHT